MLVFSEVLTETEKSLVREFNETEYAPAVKKCIQRRKFLRMQDGVNGEMTNEQVRERIAEIDDILEEISHV